MAGTHFSRILRSKIEERLNRLIDLNGRGTASTHEEYRQNVGHIQGLEESIKLIEQVEGEQD